MRLAIYERMERARVRVGPEGSVRTGDGGGGKLAGSETGAPAFAKGPCGRPPGAAGLGSEMRDLGKIKVN